MSTPLDIAPEHERELVLARRFEASPEACFRCWTEPELMKQWFTPAPWKTVEVRNDVRAGGASFVVMEGPDGTRVENPGVFLEVIPNRKLVFTDAFASAWVPSAKPFMVAIVTFEPDGPDGRACRYIARARHWTAEDKAQHEAMGFHAGWGAAGEQLEALARTL